jgi:hypothetical protein
MENIASKELIWSAWMLMHPIVIFYLVVSLPENSKYYNNEISDFVSGPWVSFLLPNNPTILSANMKTPKNVITE